MNFSVPGIMKFLLFSQKKAFLIFRETKTPKKIFLFQKTSHISGSNFPSSKSTLKKYLILQEIELSSPKLIKLITFQERTCKN